MMLTEFVIDKWNEYHFINNAFLHEIHCVLHGIHRDEHDEFLHDGQTLHDGDDEHVHNLLHSHILDRTVVLFDNEDRNSMLPSSFYLYQY